MENMYGLLALVGILLSVAYYYFSNAYGYWNKKGVPCPGGIVPGFGHVAQLMLMRKNLTDLHVDLYNKIPGASMIGFYNMQEPSLMVRDPELVKAVMVKNFTSFGDNAFAIDKDLDPLLALNPFFVSGDRWKTGRQQLSAAFTPGKLKFMFTSVNEVCNQMKGYLNNLTRRGNGVVEIELKELFSRFTSGVVASAAFGMEGESFESDKNGPFDEIGKLTFEPSLKKGLFQLCTFFLPFVGKMFGVSFLPSKADRFFRDVVKNALRHRREQGIDRPDFLQLMIQYRKSAEKNRLSSEEFNDEIITAHATSFFADGYESSSITMAFAAYLLATHPEIQKRVRRDVEAAIAKHGGPNYEAIQDMKYMDQALCESMRLFPVLGALLKRCGEEIELVGSDGISCKVEPGTTVVVPVMGLQRDPKYWTDPDRFDPERFSEKNKHNNEKFAYLPFGEGPRICVGMRMGMMQVKAALATLVLNFNLETSPKTKTPIQLRPTYFLTSAIGGLWVKLKPLSTV